MNRQTYIDTLRVQTEEAASQVRLRLSAQLTGADLRPPGLAPAQVLLAKNLVDPEPRRVSVDGSVPVLDRAWERSVRDALADRLRQAVRPTNGQVPPGAEAVLFRDAAEAWACWTWQQARPAPLSGTVWWVRSLERSADVSSSPRGSMSVTDVWRAHPRLVPPIVGSLAAWGHAEKVLPELSEADAEALLRAVCTTYDVSGPFPAPVPESPPEADAGEHREEAVPTEDASPNDATVDEPSRATSSEPEIPPWTAAVKRAGGSSLSSTLAWYSRAHWAFFGMALALQDDPVAVRSRSFQRAWRAWREAAREDIADPRTGTDAAARSFRTEVDPEATGRPRQGGHAEKEGGTSAEIGSSDADDSSSDAVRRVSDQAPTSDTEVETSVAGSYAGTDLGGVLYLVNVLDALDLPAAAKTPPVGEHVWAWAVLETLARALLGPESDALRPNDSLWRVLAALDGRRPEMSAGRALGDAVGLPTPFRLPPAWLEVSPFDTPVEGRWAVQDGRLLVWTDAGPVADLQVAEDPVAQAEEAWRRCPNTQGLQRADSSETMPLAYEPSDCLPALAQWGARVAPYLRHRLAAVLGVDDRDAGWLGDLFTADGTLYTTDTHVDLVLPLDAARLDVRAAGLDRSPGWWPAGGRVVRFHFRDTAP